MEENINFDRMITQVRAARPSIMLNGKDYFGELAPYFLSLSYTDSCDGEHADDLQLHLADRDRRFISDWMPDKGESIEVSIIAERWFAPNASALSLDCGEFWIDTVDFELPHHTVSVKATSIPTDTNVKGNEEQRGWEDDTLEDIADQIAGESDMEVEWESEYNPRYTRVEQISQSSLHFLKERANDVGLSIKVARRKIIFFDEAEYEKKAPSFTIVYGNAAGGGGACYRMSGGHFRTKVVDTTKKADVSNLSEVSGSLLKGTYSTEDEEIPSMPTLKVNVNPDIDQESSESGSQARRVRTAEGLISGFDDSGSSAGSQRKAKAIVRDANKDKERAQIDLSIGNPLIAAGQTFMLSGVGQFDGKWFLEKAHHTVGPMYTTQLEARRCLEGY